jgi:ribosomal-protein-alanine N-acetyltransferase
MGERPTLETPRLVLRPFVLGDAPDVQRLAGAREVAATTLNIPHPYEEGMAEAWIGTHQERFDAGAMVTLAVTLREGGALIGAIALRFEPAHQRAEMGYWIAVPHWNQGYCTEAARAMLRYGFEERALHRIGATHLGSNPASGRVMQKIGMTYEGRLRDYVKKWGRFEDLVHYGLLRDAWEGRRG